jgi:hypothetical protein
LWNGQLGWLARLRISALQDSREEGFWNNHLGDRRDTSALGDYPFNDPANGIADISLEWTIHVVKD